MKFESRECQLSFTLAFIVWNSLVYKRQRNEILMKNLYAMICFYRTVLATFHTVRDLFMNLVFSHRPSYCCFCC